MNVPLKEILNKYNFNQYQYIVYASCFTIVKRNFIVYYTSTVYIY